MLDFVVDELPRITGTARPERHLCLAPLNRPLDRRVFCQFPRGQERHAGLQHVVVALAHHHLGGRAVGAEVVAAVFVAVVVAFGLVLAVLHGAVVRVAEADDELAGCVVEAVLVEG